MRACLEHIEHILLARHISLQRHRHASGLLDLPDNSLGSPIIVAIVHADCVSTRASE